MGSLFATVLVDWYRVNQRNLPWRETKDSYRIWISEIILSRLASCRGMIIIVALFSVFLM